MEKSLKSTNSFLLCDINFDGFSSSNNWLGYVEKSGVFKSEIIGKTIDLFKDFFDGKENFFILSALAYNDERIGGIDISERVSLMYENMKKIGVLSRKDEVFDDYLYGDKPLSAKHLRLDWKRGFFCELSELVMCHPGVVGQVCFYINLEENVAIYPHDDVGFGCIGLNGDRTSGVKFLDFYKGYADFNVFIEGDD